MSCWFLVLDRVISNLAVVWTLLIANSFRTSHKQDDTQSAYNVAFSVDGARNGREVGYY